MLLVTVAIFTSVIDVFPGIEMADAGTHRIKIEIYVDFAARQRLQNTSARPKEKFKLEFEGHGVNVKDDNDFIHPSYVYLTCVGPV